MWVLLHPLDLPFLGPVVWLQLQTTPDADTPCRKETKEFVLVGLITLINLLEGSILQFMEPMPTTPRHCQREVRLTLTDS